MTLPIAFVRPPKSSPSPAGADVGASPGDATRSFDKALSSAMRETPPSTRDGGTARRARANRPTTPVDEGRDEAVRHEAARSPNDSTQVVGRRDLDTRRDGGRGEVDRDDARIARGRPGDRREDPNDSARLDDTRDRARLDEPRDRARLDEPRDRAGLDEPRDRARLDEPRDRARLDEPRDKGVDVRTHEATAHVGTDRSIAPQMTAASIPVTSTAARDDLSRAVPADDARASGASGAGEVAGERADERAGARVGEVTRELARDVADFVAHSLESAVAPMPMTDRAPLATVSRTGSTDAIANPLAVRRDMEGVAPELRARLERVVDRMEQEYGYTVEVIETLRSPERQAALFAQGRTAPGTVVTWTRHSKHLDGAAADVIIDGGYDNAPGFARLAQVAREEGLRTLWPKDSGHIELTGTVARPEVMTSGQVREGQNGASAGRSTGGDARATAALPQIARAAIDPAIAGQPLARSAPEASALLGRPASPVAEPPHTLPFPVPELHLPVGPAGDNAPALPARLPVDGIPMPLPAARPAPAPTAMPAPMPAALPNQQALAASPGVARVATVAAVTAPTSVARVASVASVATVATVATVASVASVSQGGAVSPVTRGATPDVAMPNATPADMLGTATIAAGQRDSRRNASADSDTSGDRGERAEHGVTTAAPAAEGEASRFVVGRDTSSLGAADRGDMSPVAGLTRSDATERIARVLALQEAANDRPMSSVLLRLDHPEGGEDRIRIDLRGHTVGATLDIADAGAAEQLRSHAPELQRALQRQGLDGDAMVVRTSSRSMDASVLTASAVAAERDVARAASATASDGGGSTAKDSRNPPRAHERDGTDQQRSRQRRDGKGDTR